MGTVCSLPSARNAKERKRAQKINRTTLQPYAAGSRAPTAQPQRTTATQTTTTTMITVLLLSESQDEEGHILKPEPALSPGVAMKVIVPLGVTPSGPLVPV